MYRRGGTLFRQVNESHREHFQALFESGLYDELTADGLLIPHEERPIDLALTPEAFRVLEPFEIPMVSYPYEWGFGMLKDAALTTLEIQKRALARGMTLKDASAYNIQFREGKPILIDTLSFEARREGAPWIAYRQFCQHFLAPLAMMSIVDVRLGRLLQSFLDGVPLDLAGHLLPRRSWSRLSLALHIHLHARSIRRHADATRERIEQARYLRPRGLEALLDNLESAVRRLDWGPAGTEWAEYEDEHGYSSDARSAKEHLVLEWLRDQAPETVWDLGSNTGFFSRIASSAGSRVVALDGDPAAVEILYRQIRREDERRILPLWIDLANPSPSLGWAHAERASLMDRGPADTVLALALVHHLAIGNNLPLDSIARLFSELARHAIVEFVPKSDPQAQRLLVSREDIFHGYTKEAFEQAFTRFFRILHVSELAGSGRWLYNMIRVES